MSSRDNPVKDQQTCPGLKDFMQPTVAYVKCHVCGGNMEIWSDENIGICIDFGAEWKRPDKNASCLDYCQSADECRGIIASRTS